MNRTLLCKKVAPFLQLGKAAAGQHPPLEPHAASVWRTLDAKSQAMVLETEQPVGRKKDMSESIEDLMTEIRGRIELMESALPTRIDAMVSPE